MQIAIEISSYDKEWITNGYHIPEEINMKISREIANGTPLDKTDNSVLEQLKDEIQEKGFNSPLINPVFTMTEILEMIDKHIYGASKAIIEVENESEE